MQCFIVCCFAFAVVTWAQPSRAAQITAQDLGVLHWRVVGPAVMGGRLDVVVGVAGDPRTVYLGHSSGGLYKSSDGGLTFVPTFSAGNSTAIGALAVAPSNPKIVVIGTGEGFPRNTAAPGDGVYKSTDAGKTWRYIGLGSAEHIAKIAIDPHNSRVILVAALGPEWTPGGQRGIYRTQDGGATWQRVIGVNATTGGSDVTFDPGNSRVVYAGTFDFLRRPWTFRGGGPGSGLYRSIDNGRTWQKLTDPQLHNGLPGGDINRVGVGLSYHHPSTVYALVPTRNGMLYRSNDGGGHWKLVNASEDINFRPFYFSQVRVDPDNPERVYVVTGENLVSNNGGRTFKLLGGGGDNHDIWIDPADHDRLLDGSDFGFDKSVDGGATWNHVNTVPFAQIYRVGYDSAVPYHIMGGMQDHEVWWGPNSLWNDEGVPSGAWRRISDWGDGQYAVADPRNPDWIYEDTHFGDLTFRNLRTGEARYISPQPEITFGTGVGDYPYRFNWSAPLYLSPHDPRVLYFGANVLFKTEDRGQSWQTVSPDLTQPCNNAWLGPSGGPISHDNTNSEAYCTIYAISEDAVDPGTLWVGTDDGKLDITRDGGKHWTDVAANIAGLPPQAWFSSVHASRMTPGVAYVSVDQHRFGDQRAYVYYTTDYGKTWMDISRGLPLYAYVVREDPRQPNLLFVGTEAGVWASFDRGAGWSSLQLGEAPVPVYDLKIEPTNNDLIAGTHGRGFSILDDITPLERLAQATTDGAMLFPPPPAWRYVARPTYEQGRGGYVSENKPYGASLSYYLAPQIGGRKNARVTLEIVDVAGKVVRTLDEPAHAGVNRIAWDLREDPPRGKEVVQDPRDSYVFYSLYIVGPQVLPGAYTVRLIANGTTYSAPLNVKLDPALDVSVQALQAQYDACQRLAHLQEQDEVMLNELRGLDEQIASLLKRRIAGPLAVRLSAYRAELSATAARLANGDGSENAGYKHPAQLIDQIAYQRHILDTYVGAPTDAQKESIERYAAGTATLSRDVETLFAAELTALNAALGAHQIAPLRLGVTHSKRDRDSPPPSADPDALLLPANCAAARRTRTVSRRYVRCGPSEDAAG